jgi:hypothetical protein
MFRGRPSRLKDIAMTKSRRHIPPYNAWWDALRRWPHWKIRPAKLAGQEKVIYPDEHVILFEETLDAETQTAQAVAHLDLGHVEGDGRLPDEAAADALGLAKLRLDEMPAWRVDHGTCSGPVDRVRTERAEDTEPPVG